MLLDCSAGPQHGIHRSSHTERLPYVGGDVMESSLTAAFVQSNDAVATGECQ